MLTYSAPSTSYSKLHFKFESAKAFMDNFQRIAFFWVGTNTEIPAMLVQSIRLAFGDAMEIVQLSDKGTPRIAGVTRCKNLKLSPRIMVARLEAYASLSERIPTLYLDADMLIVRPFDLPSLAENEIGVTHRDIDDSGLINWRFPIEYPELEGKKIEAEMPYIYSFIYASTEILFLRQLTQLRKLPKRYQEWYGDQITLKKELGSARFVLKDFDAGLYNRTVKSAIEFKELTASMPDLCITHFKGARAKDEMRYALSYLNESQKPS